jgi:hypothetical protein
MDAAGDLVAGPANRTARPRAALEGHATATLSPAGLDHLCSALTKIITQLHDRPV